MGSYFRAGPKASGQANRFRVYGLGLSLNRPLPGLEGLPRPARINVRVRLGSMPSRWRGLPEGAEEWFVSAATGESGEPALRVWRLAEGPSLYFKYSEGVQFFVSDSGSRVWAIWPDTATIEDVAVYFLGNVLGLVLRLRGIICLHGSAVAVDGRAVVLVGPGGAGKSSTAAALARRGCPVLSDDIVAIAEEGDAFLAQPGYPRLCLWPQSVAALHGTPDALPPLAPPWDKRYLDLTGAGCRFQPTPLPLSAIYLLGERSDDPAAPFCQELDPREGFVRLTANTYANCLLDRAMRAREFEVLGRAVLRIPVRRVIPATDIARLPDLPEAILGDLRGLGGAAGTQPGPPGARSLGSRAEWDPEPGWGGDAGPASRNSGRAAKRPAPSGGRSCRRP